MNAAELLMWVKGTGFNWALTIMLVGIIIRLFEILMLGRPAVLYEKKNEEMASGLKRIVSLFKITKSDNVGAWYSSIAGYVFHVGFFVIVLLYIPHIVVFKSLLGFSWAGLPTPVIDAITVITMIALLIKLYFRLTDPVQKMLSQFQDYLVWVVTFLPLITGYMAFHSLYFSYDSLLVLHILSVELLMVLLPFTKLMHTVTIFMGRWYNGAMAGTKGVEL